VAFVSLAAESREQVELFREHRALPWPCGFAVPRRVFAALGVVPTPSEDTADFQAIPTLFVIGSDGTVLWHDGCSRYTHRPDTLDELGRQIERALAAPATRHPRQSTS
jgi:hypothetical protein